MFALNAQETETRFVSREASLIRDKAGAVMALAAVVVVSVLAASSAAAQTTYVPAPDVVDDIAQYVGQGGRVYGDPMPCGAVCSDLWLEEHRPIPNQPSSQQLHRELFGDLYEVRKRTGLLPKFGWIASRFSLVAGAGVVGFEVGQTGREFFMGVLQPSGPHTTNYADITHFSFLEKGQEALPGVITEGIQPVLMPWDGWIAETGSGQWGGLRHIANPGSNYPDCDNGFNEPLPDPGAGWQLVQTAPSSRQVNCGTAIDDTFTAIAPLIAARPDGTIGPPAIPWTGDESGTVGLSMYSPAFDDMTDTPFNWNLQQRVEDQLLNHPGRYDLLLPWLEYKLSGEANLSDPLEVGEDTPDIRFRDVWEHWIAHGDEFDPVYDDMMEYWEDAVDIVKRGRRTPFEGVHRCVRQSDQSEIFWDPVKEAIVFVDNDGNITTYYPRYGGDGYEYWEAKCRGE